MCGFFAVFGRNSNTYKKNKFVTSSLMVKHRGPDHEKFIFNKNFNIYHSRLSIVDLSKKAIQPFQDEKKRYYLIYNGEIYNYLQLKNILKKKYKFKTTSDTEVLLFSFIEWGLDCLQKLRGMFSFAIWDTKLEKLYLCRDKFGQKQLYYYLNKKQIFISSEIKPILNFNNLKKLNLFSVSKYLQKNEYGGQDETFFEDVKLIPPGMCGIWHNGNLNHFDYRHQSEKDYLPVLKKNLSQSTKILKDSIDKHLIGDVDVGLALSSGLDSTSLLALIKNSKLKNKLVKAFTIDFGEDFSEYFSAKKKAKRYNLELKRVSFSEKDLIRNFKKDVIVNEAPIGGVMQMALSKLFSEAKKLNLKVILSGMGADEIFLGYDSMKNIIKKDSKNKIILIDNTNILNENLIANDLKFLIKENESKKIMYKFLYETKLPKNLHMMDRVSMINSIELRCPFIDADVFSYFSKSNLSDLLNNKNTKIILREVMKSIDPNINWNEKKKNVQTPQNIWMKKKLAKEFFGDILLSKSKITKTFFNHKNILNYWDGFLKGKFKSALPIWQYANIYYLDNFINEN